MITDMSIILYLLFLGGLSFLLAKSFIFDDLKYWIISKIPRDSVVKYLSEFLYCPVCIGFWIGVIIESIFFILYIYYSYYSIFVAGILSSIIGGILNRIIYREEL